MIYFDKQPNIVDGEGYTRDYLGSSFDENSHRFLPSLQNEESFNCFRNHRYISHSQHNDLDFKSLLLREQCGHCCYCMRRIGIDANDCNIEHVVPKNSPIDDFRYYASYSNLLTFHVCHSITFEEKYYHDKQEVERQTKLPHMVAYENLVASCVGCNNSRGSEKIPPLPLIQTVDSIYFYSPAGMIVTENADQEYGKAIGKLNLNKEDLKLVRLLWKKVAASSYDVQQIESIKTLTEKQNFLCIIFSKDSFSSLLPRWQNFAPYGHSSSTYYWDLFLRFDWFYDYYKHHDKYGNRL